MTADWPAPEQPSDPPTPTSARRGLPTPALVPLAALVWWGVGFLPWILGGLGHDVLGEVGTPLAAIPLFAGNVSALVVGSGVGGLAAGLVSLLGRGGRAGRLAAVAAGVALTVAVVLVQSRSALADTDGRVLDGLTAMVVAMSAVALAVGLLALVGRVGLGIALAGVAGAAPVWLSAVLFEMGLDRPGTYETVGEVARWVGALVLVGSLVAIGLRPLVRVVWWPVAVLLAWVVGPTVTAAAYIEPLLRPGMGLPDMLDDHISASLDVWRMAASPDARPLATWIVAIIAAAVTSVLVDRAGTPRGPRADAQEHSVP